MVVFTCNHCGESLQKPRVEKHYNFTCRSEKFLTCVDCFKDFRGEDYDAHTKCVSEEQRYSGKDYVEKTKKGEVKQESWMEMIKSILMHEPSLKPQYKSLLNTISNYNNVPRKKIKFINFIKSSTGGKTNISDIENVWDIIEKYKSQNKSSKENNTNGNENGKDDSVDKEDNITDEVSPQKKKKSKNTEKIVDVIVESETVSTSEDGKKNKKTKKHKVDEENVNVADNLAEVPPKKKKSILINESENVENNINGNELDVSENGKKNKKIKKQKIDEEIVSIADNLAKVSPKKKKSISITESEGIENNINNGNENSISDKANSSCVDTLAQTENGKNNKKHKVDEEIVNVADNLTKVPSKKKKSISITESEGVENNINNGNENPISDKTNFSCVDTLAETGKKNKKHKVGEEIVNAADNLTKVPSKKKKSSLINESEGVQNNIINGNEHSKAETENVSTNENGKKNKKTKKQKINEENVADNLTDVPSKKKKSVLVTESESFGNNGNENSISNTANFSLINISAETENVKKNKKHKVDEIVNAADNLVEVPLKKKKSIESEGVENDTNNRNGNSISDKANFSLVNVLAETKNGKKNKKHKVDEEIVNTADNLVEVPLKKKKSIESEGVGNNTNNRNGDSISDMTKFSLNDEIMQILGKQEAIKKSKLCKRILKKYEKSKESSITKEKMLKKINKKLKKHNNIVIENDCVKLINK